MFTRRENIYYGVMGTIGVLSLMVLTFNYKEHLEIGFALILILIVGCIILEKTSIMIGEFTLTLDTSLMLASYFIMGIVPTLWIVSLVVLISDGYINSRPKRKVYSNIGMFILMFSITHVLFEITGNSFATVTGFSNTVRAILFGASIFVFNWVMLYIQFNISFLGQLPDTIKETFIWDVYSNLITIPLSIILVNVYYRLDVIGVLFLITIILFANLLFRLIRNLTFMNNELRVVQEVSASISSRLDLSETTTNILKGINELVNCDFSAILELNKDNMTMKTLDYRNEGQLEIGIEKVDRYITDNIEGLMEHKKSFIIEDVKKSKIIRTAIGSEEILSENVGSILYEPLILEKDTIGCLLIFSKVRNRFSKEHLNLLDILANQVVVAIENARLYKDVHNRSIRDGLTGLFNQRYFYDILDTITSECTNCDKKKCADCNKTSLIIFDIDHFKRINDTHGHQTGDKILKTVSEIIKNNVRVNDIVSRYGGEEFTVILPHTDQTKAYQIADRVREAIESHQFFSLEGEKVRVTISGGVSEFPHSADSSTSLVAYADRAMYSGAKKQGRNRIGIYLN